MFNNITVMSRRRMEDTSYDVDSPSIIISISDANAAPPSFAENSSILDVLYLFFDDEESVKNEGMTEDDAAEIVDFIANWQDDDVDLFVHCGAGVSRSAGTAAAIMLWQWGDDSDIFANGKYAPNMHCYRSVLDAADLEYDDIQLAKKERDQFLLWKEERANLFE